MPAPLYPRHLRPRVDEALRDTPVVLVNGPRRAGKTTLVQQFAGPRRRYLTLDDAATLLSAQEDPVGLVRGLDRAVIDEVQRAPRLLLALKQAVDQDRRPGRFLLTGSANLLLVPGVADSLAGRMETLARHRRISGPFSSIPSGTTPPSALCRRTIHSAGQSPFSLELSLPARCPRSRHRPERAGS